MRAADNNPTEALLDLWEAALGKPASACIDALLEASAGHSGPARTLGERNARLIELHGRLFGREIDMSSRCPSCDTVAQFSVDCTALAAQMRPLQETPPPYRLQVQGHTIEFRLPDAADVALASATAADDDQGDTQFTQRLLDCCVLACTQDGKSIPASQLPVPVLDALSQKMEALDPGASVSFALDCPQCAARWQAPFDVGDMLWRKVRAAAERMLLDVDALARAYGWTEREVLRLSPLRRAAYLQMVMAGE